MKILSSIEVEEIWQHFQPASFSFFQEQLMSLFDPAESTQQQSFRQPQLVLLCEFLCEVEVVKSISYILHQH